MRGADRMATGRRRLDAVRVLPLLLLAALSVGSGGASGRQSSKPAAPEIQARSSYGPYWTTRLGFDTRISIQSPDAHPRKARLEVIDEDGSLLWASEISLAPLERRLIGLEDLVGRGHSGHLKLTFDEDIGLLPAGAVIHDGSTELITTFIDERLLGHYSAPQVGFVRPGRGAPSRGVIVVTNVGAEDVRGEITIASQRRSERIPWEGRSRSKRTNPLVVRRPGHRSVADRDRVRSGRQGPLYGNR